MKKIVFLLCLLLSSLTISAVESGFYMDAVDILPGQEQQLTLKVVNSEGIKGFQLNVVMPDGLSVVDGSVTNTGRLADIGYTVRSSIKSSGTLGLIAVHGGTPIPAGDGAIISFKVKAAADAVEGEVAIKLTGIKISFESQNYTQPDVKVSAYIGNRPQNVGSPVQTATAAAVYSLHGRLLVGENPSAAPPTDRLRPGVYIVGGRKRIIKQ